VSVTQLRVSGRLHHELSPTSRDEQSPNHSHRSPHARPHSIYRPGRPLSYHGADRFLSPPSVPTHGEWHLAFMARVNERQSPGEQLDLPEFADDVSSDMSSHDQVDEFLVDGTVSDGELRRMPPQIMRGHTSGGGAFNLSEDDDHIGDTYGDEDEDDVDDADDSLSELDHGNASATSLSNRDVNVSKAIALKNAMLRNLMHLAFNQDVSRAALDAGVREIEQYDSDCELAYVDIFMILIKLVCDAHHEITPPTSASMSSPLRDRPLALHENGNESPRVQFKWPVFDMAQFEFGNARAGTCFESVCVVINLPKVAMDRTEELVEILSSCLFSMIGDPIQVLIPSVSATGRTKGHAFLEFDDPAMARTCAAAVDGLTWGRGPYGRLRAKLFRQYQVKSPATPGALVGITHRGANREAALGASRPPQPAQRRDVCQSVPPRYEDSLSAELLRQSRELSREDLNASDVSNSVSWNTDSQASLGYDEPDQRRAHFHLNRSSSGRQLQHSLSSLEDLAFDRTRGDGTMHLGELRLSSDGEEDDFDGASSTTETDLELAEAILNRARTESSTAAAASTRALRIQSLRQSLPPLPSEPSTSSVSIPRFLPSASVSTGEPRTAAASMASPARPPPSGVDIEGPWKAYCEELIQRNREMQEQVAYARRRIAALGHNNQKLHLLIDRMERDRDGLMFENDLLQTQLHGYEDHERQQEALMKELAALRRRMKRRDQRIERELLDSSGFMGRGRGGVAVDLEGGVMSIDELEEQLVQNIVSSRRLDDLKEWEQMLEGSLARVRSIKEEIALELQKRVAQQNDDHQAQDHKLCVVCLSNEKSILCLPCRHLCLCQECSQHEELDKCPICRLVVENMLLVYA
jgi:hypothetical protein